MGYQDRHYFIQVDGPPPLKRRARATRSGRVYTDAETVADEKRVNDAFKDFYPLADGLPSKGPFSVEIRIYTPRNLDGDNVEKAVMDALSGTLWENDKWVFQMWWIKFGVGHDATTGECIRVKVVEFR